MKTDIIIIGAGPAGLTAAIYARRAGKSVKIIEKSTFGGQMTYSPKIENYPAFEAISGIELADKMVTQALSLGAEIELEEVVSVVKNGEGDFTVTTTDGEHSAASVIIAAGAEHRRLGLEGEDDLIGNGVSFCAVCDGAFYAGQTVAVIGGGNSAVVEASLLAETSKKVVVVQNLSALTAESAAVDALLAHNNVEVICDTVVESYIVKDGAFSGLVLKNAAGERSELAVDGVFIAIGLAPANAPFEKVGAIDARGYIEAGESCATGTDGVFAVGDCRTKAVRQISTATADGAVAAVSACRYLDSLK